MQASFRDERISARADEVVELGRMAEREDLGEDLGDEVDEAYGPVVAEASGIRALREQREERLVEAAESAPSQLVELLEDSNEILPNNGPACAKKLGGEAVGSRGLARG